MMRSLLTLIALLAALPGPPAMAAETTRFRDWQVTAGDGACVASHSVSLADPVSGLATVALYRQEADTAIITVRVPLGVSLASGIAYTHPGADRAIGLAWQNCDADSCLASGRLSAAEVTRLKKGRQVFLAFRPRPGSPALIVPISLLGVTRAWAALDQCQAAATGYSTR